MLDRVGKGEAWVGGVCFEGGGGAACKRCMCCTGSVHMQFSPLAAAQASAFFLLTYRSMPCVTLHATSKQLLAVGGEQAQGRQASSSAPSTHHASLHVHYVAQDNKGEVDGDLRARLLVKHKASEQPVLPPSSGTPSPAS